MQNSSDCLSIIVNIFIALGTVAVAVLAIWGDWVRSKLASPKLRLHLHNNRGEIFQLANGRRAIYYHLRVVNSRPWAVARNCRVVLRALYRRSPDQRFYPLAFAVVPQFIWTPSEFSPPTVALSTHHNLDFGRVEEGGTQFQPSLYFYPNNFQGYVLANDPARYELEIIADGYSAKRFQVFEVAWNGQWNDNLDQMRRNLVINEIFEGDQLSPTNAS